VIFQQKNFTNDTNAYDVCAYLHKCINTYVIGGANVTVLKIFSAKKIVRNNAVFSKSWIKALVFKRLHFVRRKLSKIAENRHQAQSIGTYIFCRKKTSVPSPPPAILQSFKLLYTYYINVFFIAIFYRKVKIGENCYPNLDPCFVCSFCAPDGGGTTATPASLSTTPTIRKP
jgi:hypothetical protein